MHVTELNLSETPSTAVTKNLLKLQHQKKKKTDFYLFQDTVWNYILLSRAIRLHKKVHNVVFSNSALITFFQQFMDIHDVPKTFAYINKRYLSNAKVLKSPKRCFIS